MFCTHRPLLFLVYAIWYDKCTFCFPEHYEWVILSIHLLLLFGLLGDTLVLLGYMAGPLNTKDCIHHMQFLIRLVTGSTSSVQMGQRLAPAQPGKKKKRSKGKTRRMNWHCVHCKTFLSHWILQKICAIQRRISGSLISLWKKIILLWAFEVLSLPMVIGSHLHFWYICVFFLSFCTFKC